MRLTNLFLGLLLIGLVDQIEGNTALIEYERDGKLMYSYVSLDLSACQPIEGQTVHFFEDYKIVVCEPEE